MNRPDTDVLVSAPAPLPYEVPLLPEGPPPFLEKDRNPKIRRIFDALTEDKRAERFSSFVLPESFDRRGFDVNQRGYAEQYAEEVEPGRVFESAQPEERGIALYSRSGTFSRVLQGESVRLQVQASPNAPVTFTSMGLGQFENELSSQTVVADEEGIATITFTASTGTKDEVSILAASPVVSGQVRFVVSVQLPDREGRS